MRWITFGFFFVVVGPAQAAGNSRFSYVLSFLQAFYAKVECPEIDVVYEDDLPFDAVLADDLGAAVSILYQTSHRRPSSDQRTSRSCRRCPFGL
jgi:hypothetical protein